MEEAKGFFVLGVQEGDSAPDIIKKKLSEYGDTPPSAVVYWTGNMANLCKDYRVVWYESGKDPEPMHGCDSIMLNYFLQEAE